MAYVVKRLAGRTAMNADWEQKAWRGVEPLVIEKYLNERPAHVPRVEARLGYDDEAVTVIFRVRDRYVRAVAGRQGNVCRDSCVEFFFTPDTDLSKGYFNIEVNCGGVVLFHFQKEPRGADRVVLPDADCDALEIAATLPARVEPEIAEPVTWGIEYRVPFAVLEKHMPVLRPAPGVAWRANLYKCADATSHPHWLSWAPIGGRLDFHQPPYFGEIVFE
jgi:hypothetical protein